MKTAKTRPSRAGFTLVEIMITVLIIGILLAIAAPQFLRARLRTQATSCQSNLKQILGAKERWAMDNNRGPLDTPTWPDLVVPGVYLRRQPQCPSAGTYTIGRLDEIPTCSIGGTSPNFDAHVLP